MSERGSAARPFPGPSERREEPDAPVRAESELRIPRARFVYAGCVLGNVLILLLAYYLIQYQSDWLEAHERIAKRVAELRVLAFAMLLAPPALVLLRNRRRAAINANGVRLSSTQIAELHGTLERFCERLGMGDVPALYVSDSGIDGASAAYGASGRHFIVIRPVYLVVPLEQVREVYEFAIARELGRIRLGHTRWWDELLVVYVQKIPFLRNPLLHARTYEHDRYGAYLAPNAIGGLIVSASGRQLLHSVDIPEYLRQAEAAKGFWAWLANLTRRDPHVAYRVRALLEAGLYDRGSAVRSA